MLTVTSFYRYVKIDDAASLQQQLQQRCSKLNLKGKILVAQEGINGSVSGTRRQIAAFKRQLLKDRLLRGVTFKDTPSSSHPFKKMIVRLRPEIVTFSHKVSLKNRARYVTPKQLRRWIRNKEVVLVDARNSYESRIGRFRNAITPEIDTFREFPKALPLLENYKKRRIVTYCTGGIRCEKASAFLKENGFEDVYQLQDGILNYIRQCPDDAFDGRCFVFDFRLSVPSGKKSKAITTCDLCHAPCYSYINCRNMKCDRMFVCCNDCKSSLSGACSKKCRGLI